MPSSLACAGGQPGGHVDPDLHDRASRDPQGRLVVRRAGSSPEEQEREHGGEAAAHTARLKQITWGERAQIAWGRASADRVRCSQTLALSCSSPSRARDPMVSRI